MTTPESILELDDALALWDWAWQILEGPRDGSRRSRAELPTSLLDVLTLAACRLALAGRHEWIARLPEMLSMHRGWLMRDTSPRARCLQAAADLLYYGGAPVSKTVRAMARDVDPNVRSTVAYGLRLADPEARALLETLATDRDRHVRSIAQERLPASEPTPWWVGKFDSDPITRLPRASDEVLAALRTVALFADRKKTAEQEAMLPRLVEALALLPTPLLLEFVRRFVTFEGMVPGQAPMLDELLRRPQGTRALWGMIVAGLRRPYEWDRPYLVLGNLCGDLGDEALERLRQDFPRLLQEYGDGKYAEAMRHIVEGMLHAR